MSEGERTQVSLISKSATYPMNSFVVEVILLQGEVDTERECVYVKSGRNLGVVQVAICRRPICCWRKNRVD